MQTVDKEGKLLIEVPKILEGELKSFFCQHLITLKSPRVKAQ